MRRKKIVDKAASILMTGIMLLSAPMSAFAADMEHQDILLQNEEQTIYHDAEFPEETDSREEETEYVGIDEEIEANEDVLLDDAADLYSNLEEEECILGESEDSENQAAPVIETARSAESYLSYVQMQMQGQSSKTDIVFSEQENAYICPVNASYSRYIRFYVTLSENAPENSKAKLKYNKNGTSTEAAASGSGKELNVTASGIVKAGMEETDCTLTVGVDGAEQVYTIKILRIPEITSVSLTTEDGSSLRELDGLYYITENQKDKLRITVDAYGTALKVNDDSIERNVPYLYSPVYDEKKECKITISTGDGENDRTESFVIKYFDQNDTIYGNCGEFTTWELENGILTIHGTGNTDNWNISKKAPWAVFSEFIESVVIEDGVTNIGTYAFSDCPELKQVSFPESLTNIERNAFSRCTSLKTVTIPESVKTIGEEAFKDCTSLEKTETGILGNSSFRGCTGLKEVTLKTGITDIPEYAFADCTALESVALPQGVTNIGNGAFSGCTGLKTVVLPESVEHINGSAFENCPLLEVAGDQFVTEEGIVYSKDKRTLILCTTLKEGSVQIPDGVITINDNAFSNCTKITEIQMPDSVTTVGESAFAGCSSLEKVTLSSSLKKISNRMFYKCSKLKEITVPESVKEIGESAFGVCSSLEKAVLPTKIDALGWYIFWKCTSLTECTVPEGITEVPLGMFQNAEKLEKVVLPADITKIGNTAFDGTNIKYVLFKGTKEQWNQITGTQFAAKAIVLYECTSTGSRENAPVIIQQPQEQEYRVGEDAQNGLQIQMEKLQEEGSYYYFTWYKNSTKDTNGGKEIAGTTGEDGVTSFCTPDTDQEENVYYYCMIVKVDSNGVATWTYSDAAAVSVSQGLFEGTGSEQNPYILATADDLIKLRDLVNDGNSMSSIHFKLESDITLPEGWTPIGVTKDGSNDIKKEENLNAFSGSIDGNGKTITVPENGLPLLGYVKDAEVRNLNIYGTRINGCGLVNNLEGVGLEGRAILIDNVTLKAGTQTLKSGFIGANITTSGFAGCSAGFVTTIRNCTVESGCVIGYQKDQSMIGSIAGRIQGTIENCVSHATVYGTEYVGGIAGTKDNAMGSTLVENCMFDGSVEASGSHAGGIVGGGYTNSTAPNGIHMTVNRCTASGSITGADKVGGILGGDSYVAQAWNYYTMKGNTFTGTVKATSGNAAGGIIGYYLSLNKYDDIANNSYKADCGAEKGIGFVQYVDTNNKNHETESGTIYLNTENGVEDCPAVTGCAWREQHNRTDDPLGADASAIAGTGEIATYVTSIKLSGTYKTEYYLLEELDLTGMIIKAAYSDGTVKEIRAEDVTVTGFDNTTRGEQTVTVIYEGARADFTIKMKKEAGKILITFQLLGDALHGEDGSVHTLAGGSLTSWIPATSYTVDENDTVYDIMKMIAEKTGFQILERASQYGTYIEGIVYNGVMLKEFDNGKNSGWMYTVNGEHPNVGVKAKYPADGDVIVFHYTDDYTKEEGNPHEHSWGSGRVTKAPTCTASGIRTYTCECGETMTETIPAAGHKYGSWITTSRATVSSQAVQTRTCSVCKKKETRKAGSKLKPTMTVNLSTVPLKVKQKTGVLRVTGLANGDKVQSYKSGNMKIFTVSKSGMITAGKKTGKATLTITLASGLKKNITVKVQKKAVATTKITGLQSKITLKKGQKLTLKPGRQPLTSTQKFTYKSSGKKIAAVNSKGVITAKKEGKTKITVKSGKKKFIVTVTVTK